MDIMDDPLILVVDDDSKCLKTISSALSQVYRVITAEDGKQAIQQITANKHELIVVLLDLHLPDIDGLEVLKKAYLQGWTQKIIFIMMASSADDPAKIKCLEYGATDFLTKPIGKEFIKKRVERAIADYNQQQAIYDMLVDQITQRDTRTALLIYILAQVLKQNNSESGEHVLRIRIITRIILEALLKVSNKYELTAEDISAMSLAACLHDIGKVKISNKILNKPGSLNQREIEEIKKHTIYGEEMLKEYSSFLEDDVLEYAKKICRWHHERWDGAGYPDKLVGDAVPIWAQVVAVSDCYDALISDRCYKKAYTPEKAIEMILNGECGTFNPEVLKALEVAADKLKSKVAAENSIMLDTRQDAKRFADQLLTTYRQHLK